VSTLSIDEVTRSVRQLPSLPAVVAQLLDLFSADNPDCAAIGHAFDRDQALAARVLRVANSPFYGMPGQVASVHNAIVVLGLRNLRNLTLAAAVTTSFPAFTSDWFDQKGFWQHSLAVAQGADVLALRAGMHQESAFTAGLLHDIGRLVLVTCFPAQAREAVLHQREQDCDTAEAEQAVLGLDHAMVGAALARRWKFPAAVQQAIARHHAAAGDAQAPDTLADLLHLADVTAHALDLSGDPHERVPRLDGGAWHRLGLQWSAYGAALRDIEQRSADAGRLLAA